MLIATCVLGTKVRFYDSFKRRGVVGTIKSKANGLVELQLENSSTRVWVDSDTPVMDVLEVGNGT